MIRICSHCESSANNTDIHCRQCGTVLPASSYESAEQVNSKNWWKWLIGFDGRINRFGLIVRWLIYATTFLVFVFIGLVIWDDEYLGVYIGYLAGIPIFLCGAIRRYHDRGKSGWWVLALIIPFLNFKNKPI